MSEFDPEKPFGGVPISIAVVHDPDGRPYLSIAAGPYPDNVSAEIVQDCFEASCISEGVPIKFDDISGFVRAEKGSVH
jgi:hypothetical protein